MGIESVRGRHERPVSEEAVSRPRARYDWTSGRLIPVTTGQELRLEDHVRAGLAAGRPAGRVEYQMSEFEEIAESLEIETWMDAHPHEQREVRRVAELMVKEGWSPEDVAGQLAASTFELWGLGTSVRSGA